MNRLRNVKHMGVVRRFARETRASTVVEFTMVLVPFLGLLLTIIETGYVVWTSEGLQTAVSDAARNLLTGNAQAQAIASADQFRTTYICPAGGPRVLPSFIDCSKLIIDVRSYPVPAAYSVFATLDVADDFYAADTPRLFCPGSAGAITVVRVAYPMPLFLPTIVGTSPGTVAMLTAGLVVDVPGTTGYTHLLLATAVFQAEPYGTGAYTPPAGC